MKNKLLLSIGIIFKNEIRCLERCMRSLQPLRDAVPCQLVMADTGSTDGSREIAAQYADILFDFPWIDDFSAARNAVMDRCSGEWFLTIDADEWLDEDISQLVAFLRAGAQAGDVGAVVVRNYRSYDPAERDDYADGMPTRLLRMSTGLRYQGVIHENWFLGKEHQVTGLRNVILHHDGYVCLNNGEGQEKRTRNLRLLRQVLAQDPDDLWRLQQYIESSGQEPDHLDAIRRAVGLVQARKNRWERNGPPILRSAVMTAQERNLPELAEWIRLAEELFPESFPTRLDVEYVAFGVSVEKKDREDCARRGERWLAALEDYQSGRGAQISKLYGSVKTAASSCEAYVRVFTANAHVSLGQPEQARRLLEGIDGTKLDGEQAGNLAVVFQRLHYMTKQDDGPLLERLWDEINRPIPTPARKEERRTAFLKAAAGAFTPAYLQKSLRDGALRRAYTLYEPLAGQCEVGTAAAILAAGSLSEMKKLLGRVEDWAALPPLALEEALLSGVAFPLPGKPLKLEEADTLAFGLSQDPDALYNILDRAAAGDGSWQALSWRRALALASVQAFDWTGDGGDGVALARTFAKAEGAFLTACYTPEVLQEENICALPPMHRFGWYCARAFDALAAGDAVGYVRFLRAGLETNQPMKPMVEYLTDHMPELQAPKPSGELLALAERVRTLLARYPVDDPAVEALKQSASYQKVAHLIEGPDLGVFGGLKQ